MSMEKVKRVIWHPLVSVQTLSYICKQHSSYKVFICHKHRHVVMSLIDPQTNNANIFMSIPRMISIMDPRFESLSDRQPYQWIEYCICEWRLLKWSAYVCSFIEIHRSLSRLLQNAMGVEWCKGTSLVSSRKCIFIFAFRNEFMICNSPFYILTYIESYAISKQLEWGFSFSVSSSPIKRRVMCN